MAYRVAFPPYLVKIHDVFNVSLLRKCIPDPSHVIQLDDNKVRENLIVETLSLRIEDREVKSMLGIKIASVKVFLGRSYWWKYDVGAQV